MTSFVQEVGKNFPFLININTPRTARARVLYDPKLDTIYDRIPPILVTSG